MYVYMYYSFAEWIADMAIPSPLSLLPSFPTTIVITAVRDRVLQVPNLVLM